MEKNAKILSQSLLDLMIWGGGISCTTSLDEEIPLKLASPGVEVIEGTLKVNSFDTYEELITGEEKIGFGDFLSFQKQFDELRKSGENLRISQEGYNEITAWEGSTLQKSISQSNTLNNSLEATYYSSSRGLDRFYLRTQFYGEPGGSYGYSPSGSFWQFNLKQIDKGY
ncbi:hypothetical protein [Algoriphagus namhaensis]